MEKNLWLAKQFEYAFSIWANDEIRAFVKSIESPILTFFNPNLKGFVAPTEGYIMADLLPALSLTVFYVGSILLLKVIIQAVEGVPPPKAKVKRTFIEKIQVEPILIVGMIYNVVQVVCCSYMAFQIVQSMIASNYGIACNPFDYHNEKVARVLWLFYMSKILDMVDTYMIVFRRKWKQLSFLHVYHHTSVFILHWFCLRASYDSDMYLTIFCNSTVHTVMYSYYFVTTLGFTVPTYIKKSITYFQMFQFVTLITQALYNLAYDCPYPSRLIYLYMAYVTSLLLLFLNFFIQSYLKKSKEKTN